VSAAWVAGVVRGRLMLERRAGIDVARAIAQEGSPADGAIALAGTMYAGAAGAASLEAAQREVAASLLLQLRVLAAWLPREGAGLLRALAGWFELANVEDRLGYLAGGTLRPPLALGVLSSAWDALAQAQDYGEVRKILRSSSWGDPGGDSPEDLLLGLRLGWLRRVVRQVPEARSWASGAAAIMLAAELFLADRRPEPSLVQGAALGSEWPEAASVSDLRRRLPAAAAWALAGVDEPGELWRAEPAWWSQVGADAETMIRSGWQGRGAIVGVAALLALDAVRIGTALAVAAEGGPASAREVLDGLC
jgi:hypothetical protein